MWISNAYSNTGVDFARVDVRDPGFFVSSADPADQLEAAQSLPTAQTTEINLVSPDFKFPQVWRSSLALDQQLPWGLIGTLEGLYTKSINDVAFENLNLVRESTAFDGRPVYGSAGFDLSQADPEGDGVLSQVSFGSTARLDPRFTNAILLTNSDEGYEYSVTAMLRKQARIGLDAMVAYTYARAENVNNGTSSRAISNWQFNENFDANAAEPGTSDFEIRHRILANVSYRIEYATRFATTVSLLYDGRAGEPFSWIYNGNVNADTRGDNDRIYIPGSEDEVVLATGNWNALDAFIAREASLRDNRGEVATRNAARAPWVNFLDLNVTQEIVTIAGQTFEVMANLLNVLNLLSADWGKVQYRTNNNYRLLDFYGYVQADDVGATITLPGGGTRTLAAGDVGKPVIGFQEIEDRDALFTTAPLSSRWQLQLGLRYTF